MAQTCWPSKPRKGRNHDRRQKGCNPYANAESAPYLTDIPAVAVVATRSSGPGRSEFRHYAKSTSRFQLSLFSLSAIRRASRLSVSASIWRVFTRFFSKLSTEPPNVRPTMTRNSFPSVLSCEMTGRYL